MKSFRFFLFLLLFFPGCAFIVQESAFKVEKPPTGVFRGIFHVHSYHSHDSKASLEEIRTAAEKANLDFVFVTDHNNLKAFEEYKAGTMLRSPLLVFGNEVSTTEGHLMSLGVYDDLPPDRDGGNLMDWIHSKGGYAAIPHPLGKKSRWLDWSDNRIEALEIYNFYYNLYEVDSRKLIFQFLFLPPSKFLKAVGYKPEGRMQLLEQLLAERHVGVLGGADAHVHVKFGGWTPENLLMSMQSVSTFVLADELTQEKVTEAVGKGRTFIAFEAFGDAGKFTFAARSAGRDYGMGDTIPAGNEVVFTTRVPEAAVIKILHKGKVVAEQEGSELSYTGSDTGWYRTEVYRNGRLWIAGSPVYVEASKP